MCGRKDCRSTRSVCRFWVEGRVYAVEPLGSDQFIDVAYGGGDGAELIKVKTRPDARFRVGDAISLNASPADIYLFDGAGDRIFPNGAAFR